MVEEFGAGEREKLGVHLLHLFQVQWSSCQEIFSFKIPLKTKHMTKGLDLTLYVQWFFVARKEKPNTRLGFLLCRRRDVKTLKGDMSRFMAILQWGTLSSNPVADKTEPWRCFPFSSQHLLHPKISGGEESKMQSIFKKPFFLKPTAP